MTEAFNQFHINATLVAALEKVNITVPTQIQLKAIPKLIENSDVIVQSGTGTGKTLAYLLPLFNKINYQIKEMQAIILAPTHELAVQIKRQIEMLADNSEVRAKSAIVIGDVNILRQIDKLKEKPHIIVGTPGRILELINKKKISAHTIKTIVIDEADKLTDKSNFTAIKAIIKATLKERQIVMASATITGETLEKANEIMKETVLIKADEEATIPPGIEHLFLLSEQRDKVDVLRKLIRIINPQKALVFVDKSEQVEIITEKLKYHGLQAESIHGFDKKADRKKAMDNFKAGKTQILTASDISARGIDVEDITHIFNLNIPEDPNAYLHRVGRTGRNGKKGIAISIVTKKELMTLNTYKNKFKIDITQKYMYKGEFLDSGENNFK